MSTTTPNVPVSSRPQFQRLRELITEEPLSWDKAWKENVTPWDQGEVQPPLRDLIDSGELSLPKQGRALVPGCGRGYDVMFIASTLGLDTLAVDISPIALQAAKDLLATLPNTPRDKVSFKETDFFTFSVPEDGRFDLIYDYTFFVAIPPSRRMEWGQQMTSLIKPGGYLITLVYPLDPQTDTGPPFFVRPEHYLEPLGDGWEKVYDKMPTLSVPSHVERERMVVWKKL